MCLSQQNCKNKKRSDQAQACVENGWMDSASSPMWPLLKLTD